MMLMSCDGFINLCDVKRVRKMHRGATPADEYLDQGSDVEFNTPEELRVKVSGRTAMMYFLANPRYDGTPMGLRTLAATCKEKGVPVYVDGAATEPGNPNPFLQEGADLVAYSGGKCMRGPQSAGILIGRSEKT